MDRLMTDLMNLDMLDLSLDDDEHELLDSCDLPHLLEESFASEEYTSTTTRDDDNDDDNTEADDDDDDERMDVENNNNIDSSSNENNDCSEEWEECGDVDDTPLETTNMTEDIQWDPTPLFPLESYRDCYQQQSSSSSSLYLSCRSLFHASDNVVCDNGDHRDIHWVPPPAATAATTTTTTTTDRNTVDATQLLSATSERSVVSSSTTLSSSSSTARSLQEEYERSCQNLVVSMMRSQQSRRYVRHQLLTQQQQQQVSSLSSLSRPDLRSEMITSLSHRSAGTDNAESRRVSRMLPYSTSSSSSCRNIVGL